MIKYPSTIDTQIELPYVVDNVTPITGELINNLRDAVVAMETELGVKPSGIYSNVRSRINALEISLGNLVLTGGTTFGGDLISITPLTQKVIGLQGNSVASDTPIDGYVLTWIEADGYWISKPGNTPPGGPDGAIQFNDAGILNGDSGLGYNKITKVVTASDALSIGGGTTAAAGLIRVKNGTTAIITKRDSAGTADKTILGVGSGDDLYIGTNSAGNQTFDYVNVYSGAGTAIAVGNDIKLQLSGNTNDFIKVAGNAATAGHIRLADNTSIKGRNTGNTVNHDILTWNSGVLTVGNIDANSTSLIGNIGVVIRGDSVTFSNTNNTQDFASFNADGFQIGSATMDLGSGTGVIGIDDATVAPTTNPTGGVILYSTSGALKIRQSNGTVRNVINYAPYYDVIAFSVNVSTNLSTFVNAASFVFDPTVLLSGTKTIKLRVIAETTSPLMTIQLYDYTNNAVISNTTLTTSSTSAVLLETGDISADLFSGGATYYVQIKMASGAGADTVLLSYAALRTEWT